MLHYRKSPVSHGAASLLLCLGLAVTPALQAADVDDAISTGVKRTSQGQTAQDKIDSLDEQIRERVDEYRSVNKEIEGLQVYIQQMEKQIASQEAEMAELSDSIDKVTLIERQITPLMLKMVEAIQQFVKLDMPFQEEKRTERVARLETLMSASDVTTAEKFRTVLEAYQDEIDYGRTIEAYRGSLGDGEAAREVDFLRIGRLALVYQTLDGKEVGLWNAEAGSWQELDAAYRRQITQGLRIAREQAAPDLIRMPMPTPVEAKQ
jgi:TolA-binding protein